MSSQNFSTFTEVGMIDARSQNGIITLPLTTDIPYRILTLKDIYGASAASSITLTTQGSDVFEDGTTSRLLNGAFETTTLYAGQPGFWYTTGGSRLATAAIGSLSTGLITNPLRLGTLSTQTSIQFPGVNTSYKGTVIAGQTTGAGTQELLLYQASTVSDQIRLQTTGNIVFEAGAAVRSFPSTQMLATPTLYIAGTTSNVGIGTATPAATLDVAGQGRFQTVSTLALNVSSINGAVPWQQSFLTSSVQGLGSAGYVSTSQLASTMSGLGSAGYISSTQLYSTVSGLVIVAASAFTGSTTSLSSGSITTNALQAYSYINMTGGVFSNVATSFFTTPKYTTTFTPTSISGLRVWFDASVTTSILSNGSGQVYQWNNLAPGFPNAVQATTANQPYTGLSNYNGLNTMSFINTNTSILNIASISYSNSYRSFFVVYQFPGTYTTGALSITDGVTIFNAPDYPSFKFGHTATPGFYNGYPIPSSSYRAGFGVLTGSLNSSLGSPFYYNGSNNAIVSGASSLFTSASYTGTIGGGNPVNICEYIGYDSELTSSQRLIVEGYLAWKWGFQSSLISTHPYYTVAPPPLGIVYLPAGSVGTDATSNLAIQATANTKISIAGNTQITGVLTTSSIGVSSITGTYASLSSLQVSSINGFQPWQQSFLTSTTQGLGLIGYISSTQLTSTVAGLNIVAANAFTGSTTLLSAGTINVSTLNSVYLSSVQGYVSSLRTDSLTVGGPTGYVTVQDLTTGTVSTGQLVAGAGFISSLQINSLSFGPTGYVIVGNFIASSLSTMKLNTQNLYTNNAYIGNVSSQSAILFPGVDGNFRGTAVAEQGTGPGTGELLLYKVSTTTDQIRLQTTGNIVFEAGASARSWPSTQTLATPTLYIQGTTSNIGVGTATPATTLDVVGTVRGQVLSTLTLNTSTINGIVPGAAFNGSTLALSTGSITTNALQAYSYINMTGGAFSNVATSFFTTPKFTTTFTPTSISGLKVWLDASKITSITSNGSGQVLSLSNLTGLGNATQGTPSSAPLTGQYTFNNLNVLSNSFNTQLVLPSINYTSQYRTAFLVLQAPHYSAWIGANRSTDSIGMWSYGDLEIETAGTWIALTSFPSNAQNIPIIIDIHSSAASNGVYMNGSNLGSLLRTFATGSFTDTIGLGGTGTPLGGYYGASWYFGEFIYYDAELTVSQRQTVEGYLAWKWGTQGLLAPTHPSYSSPPPPLGTVYLAAGSVGTDATSNLAIQATATTKISLAGNTQITGVLTTSSIGVSSITGTYASLSSVQISSINGAPPWQQSFLTSTLQGLGTVGYISTSQLTSTVQGLTSNISSMIDPTELTSSIVGLGTAGFISAVGLTYVVASTAQGLGTFGYTSTNQLLSTTIGIYGAIGSNIATTVQPQFVSTVQGLGSAGYISTASLVSTFNAITYAISQNTVNTIFYLNPGIPAPTYRQMSPNQTTLPQSTLTTFITRNTSNIPIAQFQTDFTVPRVIPGGAFDLNLFAYTDHARTYTYASLFSRAGTTETLLASSSNATTNIGTSPVQQYTNTLFVPQTIFTSTTGVSLILKVFANNPNNQDDNLYTYYQGADYSHVHTSFGTVIPDTLFTSTVAGLGSAGYISTIIPFNGSTTTLSSAVINVSSISACNISSVQGYVSSLRTDSLTVGGPTGYVTVQDLTTGTVSTGQLVAGAGFISSLQINSLSFGPTGYVIVGNFIASSLSTMKLNTQNLYTNNAYIGNVSSQSAILFPGVDGNYRGTAVAEQTTGAGTGELLLYKTSTTTDQIRLQTTGNIVFEAGASLRSWPSTQTLATPTLYIQGTTSNVGIGTAAPATTLDVVGTGRFQILSSLALNVSSINGAAPGGTFNGSTLALSTALVTTSTLKTNALITSTALITLNGSAAPTSFGFGVDTLTLQTNAAYTGGVASLAFAAATAGYPLGRIYMVDSASSGPAVSQMVFQTVPVSATSFSSNYSYTGSNQTFTVPAGVTTISVAMWGAGGGGGGYGGGTGGAGGAGAFLQGTLAVTPGQVLTLIVGQSGEYGVGSARYGGGGGNPSGGIRLSAGGRSGIQTTLTATITSASGNGSATVYTTNVAHGLSVGQPVIISGLTPSGYNGTYAVTIIGSSTQFTVANATTGTSSGTGTIIAELVDVGGGGSGGFDSITTPGTGGAASYIGTAAAGSNAGSIIGGGGGTQNSGGAAGTGGGGYGTPTAGSLLTGGSGDQYGGPGGGGYYGGGGGMTIGGYQSGGGGGSSWTGFSGFTLIQGSNSANGISAPATGYSGYQAGVAAGGPLQGAGGPGLILLASIGNAFAEAMRIGSNGYVGIGTTAPTTTLDVVGTGRFQILSTLTLNISTINGIVPGAAFTGSTTLLSAGTINVSTLNSVYLSSVQGYVSSLRTDSLTVGGPTGYVTVQDLTTGTVSTGQLVAGAGFISSLQINSLSFGPTGYVIVGNFIASSLSTMKLNTQNLYTNNAYIGNVSSQSAILFPGVDGNYRGTAVAEQTTGAGTGELLLYKTSTTTDQIRLQTTGNIVFEAGASLRSWPSTQTLATPTLYIQGTTSNVGIGTATPAATLDVVGTGRFQVVSSFALNVSSINGAAPGGTFNGSTLALSTGSVYASNVVVKNNGNVGSNTYGIGIDTLIVQTNIGALAGGIASLYFGASNPTYPLARIGAVDYGVTYGNSALVFQTATPTNASLSGVITYSYSNVNQSFTVPSGITSVTVYMWGAGGGGGSGTGGAGAFIQGTLAVTPGNTLTVIVGGGGVLNGGGTFGGGGSSGQANSASGGGRSAIQLSGTELVDVGGGGGGSYSGFQGGAANYSPTINGGAGYRGGQATYGGYGGTQTAGGAVVTGPVSTGTAGSYLQGGAGGNYGGGGGGGFYGGGGGSTAGGDGCAGGGGSSYTTNAAFTLITGSNSPNTGAQAPATASPYYVSGVAAGATGSSTGGSGLVVIVYNPPYNLSETMRISQTGSIGIGTSTPQTLLHVSGMTYSIAISTQALTVSSINGAAVPTPFSTDGLGTLGYISSTQLGSTVTNLITRIGAGGGGGGGTTFVGSTTFLSATQVLFSTQTGYNISSVLGFVSSLQVDELQIGTGFGIIALGDTNMSSISTLGIAAGLGNFQTINVSSINGALPGTGTGSGSGNFGTVSSLTAIRFFGLTGGFTNTALAEVSTGAGTQELLLYKVSSISDQVRVQTTGNVIFEAGVGARGWPVAPRLATPTFYIAGSNSNVGVGTSNPLTTLDVVGTGRFQTLSSLNITAGSINYSVAFV